MAVKRIQVSASQFCEQFEIDPRTFVSVRNDGHWQQTPQGRRWVPSIVIVVEDEQA